MQKSTLHRAALGVEAVLGGWVRSGCILKSAWQERSQELRSMLLGLTWLQRRFSSLPGRRNAKEHSSQSPIGC